MTPTHPAVGPAPQWGRSVGDGLPCVAVVGAHLYTPGNGPMWKPRRICGREELRLHCQCTPLNPASEYTKPTCVAGFNHGPLFGARRGPFPHLAPLVNRDKTQARTAHPNRPGGLGPGVVRTKPHPGSGRPARHARPGVAGNPARPGIGTGEGLGMPEPRRGGLVGCGIVRYTYELLARTLVHVI